MQHVKISIGSTIETPVGKLLGVPCTFHDPFFAHRCHAGRILVSIVLIIHRFTPNTWELHESPVPHLEVRGRPHAQASRLIPICTYPFGFVTRII